MMTQVKLLIATVILTVVIWVFADQASLGTATVWATIRLTASGDVVPVVEQSGVGGGTEGGQTARVRLDLAGSKAAIRRLTGEETSGTAEYTIRVPERWLGGQFGLDVVDAMNRVKVMHDRGLHLVSAYPPMIQVFIDPLVTATFTVQPDAGAMAASLAGPATVHPKTVNGRLRESHLTKLGTREPVVVVPIHTLLREAQGKTEPVSFRVPLPRIVQDLPVEFQPGEVTVTATLTQRSVSKRLTRIPLNVLMNPDMMGQYRVIWADDADRVQTIDVRVPPDRAESLSPQSIYAFVAISRDDVAPKAPSSTAPSATGSDGWVTRTVQFVFPPGYEDARIEGAGPTVRLKVVEIPVTPAAATPPLPPT